MKVLTIKQPYASLIVAGIKKYEFRTWKTNFRGDFLIHAGKGVDKEEMKKYKDLNLEYPSGAIIGKVTLEDCIIVDSKFREKLNNENSLVYSNIIKDTQWNGYAYKLNNVEKINPIQINGKLSFWEYNYIK